MLNFLQQFNRQLQKFVFSHLSEYEGKNLDDMINEEMIANKTLSEKDAAEEIVARACEMMLQNSAAIETLAMTNEKLANSIDKFIARFKKNIKKAFEKVGAKSEAAKAMQNYLDELQDLWDNALAKAVMNYQASDGKSQADSSLKLERKKNIPFRQKSFTDEFFTNAHIWAGSAEVGEKTTLYDPKTKKYKRIESTENGFVEIASYTSKEYDLYVKSQPRKHRTNGNVARQGLSGSHSGDNSDRVGSNRNGNTRNDGVSSKPSRLDRTTSNDKVNGDLSSSRSELEGTSLKLERKEGITEEDLASFEKEQRTNEQKRLEYLLKYYKAFHNIIKEQPALCGLLFLFR